MECLAPYQVTEPGLIFCVDTLAGHEIFTYNKQNRRFVISDPNAGYALDNIDTDSLSAGTYKLF